MEVQAQAIEPTELLSDFYVRLTAASVCCILTIYTQTSCIVISKLLLEK